MTDREQTRRDAEFRLIDTPQGFRVHGSNFQRMAGINDLSRALRESLAELKQAERERDLLARAQAEKWIEARLAKVDTVLVEALRRIEDEHTARDGEVSVRDSAAIVARDALTVWEQE